jgi:hypothetical protein
VIERLRALLERPLDPALSRAMLALALAVGTGFAIVALLAGSGAHTGMGGSREARPTPARQEKIDRAPRPVPTPSPGKVSGRDAQDHRGTAAHRRATREVADHRALQHVPYEEAAVSVKLVGVLRGRAVLEVEGPSIGAARRGWRRFLRRFDDDGGAYVPRFETIGAASTTATSAHPGVQPGFRQGVHPGVRREGRRTGRIPGRGAGSADPKNLRSTRRTQVGP